MVCIFEENMRWRRGGGGKNEFCGTMGGSGGGWRSDQGRGDAGGGAAGVPGVIVLRQSKIIFVMLLYGVMIWCVNCLCTA